MLPFKFTEYRHVHRKTEEPVTTLITGSKKITSHLMGLLRTDFLKKWFNIE